MPRHPGSPLLPLFPLTPRPTLAARALPVAAALALLAPASACVSDPDCGICDPDNLILQSIAGTNYAGKLVRLLGPECVGDACPGPIQEGEYFVETIGPCDLSNEAIAAGRGADEWCRVSPLMVDSGLQFIFNNLLDPGSVELVRKQPVNPNLFEVYDWKSKVAHIEGPITRYNGDYRPADGEAPDTMSRLLLIAAPSQVWEGGLGLANELLASPLTGPLLARAVPYMVTSGFAERSLDTVFAPQPPPEGYLDHLDLDLVLRAASLRENARQLVALKDELRPMVAFYPRLALPVALMHGDAERTVGVDIHSRPFLRQVPHARLTILPGIGHMLHQVATAAVVAEIARPEG